MSAGPLSRRRLPKVLQTLRASQDDLYEAIDVLEGVPVTSRNRTELVHVLDLLDRSMQRMEAFIEGIGLGGTGHDDYLRDTSNVQESPSHATHQSSRARLHRVPPDLVP